MEVSDNINLKHEVDVGNVSLYDIVSLNPYIYYWIINATCKPSFRPMTIIIIIEFISVILIKEME